MTENEIRLYEEHIRSEFAESDCGQECGGFSVSELMLPSHDGVRLMTVVYRPDTAAPVPAVVTRTCYPVFDGAYRIRAEEFCKRGIAYVYQYCRGTERSEGIWEPNVNERGDGKALLDWLEQQDWVESIGYLGHSYLSMAGWVLADIATPKVKTMYLTHYGAYRHTSAYQDGLFRHDVLTGWAMANAGFPITADYTESCLYRPQLEVDEKLWGQRVEWYRDWIRASDRSDSYWQQGFWKLLRDIPPKIDIPLFVGEGWYDHHLGSALESFAALPPKCREHSVLMIGAWNHGFMPACRGIEGKNYDANDEARALKWFVDILKKTELPHGQVKLYVIGDDSWLKTDALPDPDAGVCLWLRSDGGLGEPGEDGSVSYVYDPQNPVITNGAESCLSSMDKQGSLPQPKPGWRSDVITFQSMPLPRDITVTGRIKAVLTVSSDAEDTAFVVKFMEVMPDGSAYNIRTAVTTLGYRNGADSRVAYTPGDRVELTLTAWDIAWKLHRGSRLRIDVTSSDFPQYSVHSNYAGCWAEQVKTRPAIETIYLGSGESYVFLPESGAQS